MRISRSRQPESFNDRFYGALKSELLKLTPSDGPGSLSEEALSAALKPLLDRFASGVVGNLEKRQRRLIRSSKRIERGFVSRLRTHWGEALDRYYAIYVCLQELGSDFNDSHRNAASQSNDRVFEALTGLHARACRTALEVHHLLSGGFPMGALARCRTLHEIAVISGVIQKHGRDAQHPDLAERYILHDHVMNWRDAQEYQKHFAEIGDDPFTDDELAEFKARRDAVVSRFGTSYKNDNGWAAQLTGKDRPDFADLERIADLSHLRGYYKWASHEVHADAKGWRLNRQTRGGRTYLSSGQVNFGLGEPGQLALHSLQLCTTLLVLCMGSPEASDLVALLAIQKLVDKADNAFAAAEESVRAAEERLQRATQG